MLVMEIRKMLKVASKADSILPIYGSASASYFGVVRPLPKAVHRGANFFFTFIFQLSGWALVAPSCFALHCNCFLLSVSSVTVDVERRCHDNAHFARI